MKSFTLATITFAMTLALPFAAGAATGRLTEAQLRVDANVVKFCKDKNAYVASAKYVNDTDNKVAVTCSEAPVPLVALGGLGGSTAIIVASGVLAAVAIGGNDGASDTQ